MRSRCVPDPSPRVGRGLGTRLIMSDTWKKCLNSTARLLKLITSAYSVLKLDGMVARV